MIEFKDCKDFFDVADKVLEDIGDMDTRMREQVIFLTATHVAYEEISEDYTLLSITFCDSVYRAHYYLCDCIYLAERNNISLRGTYIGWKDDLIA